MASRHVLSVLALAVLAACAGDGPAGGTGAAATLVVNFLTPATTRTVVVTVSGPGITPDVIVNAPVGADSTSRVTLELPAGSGRRIVVSAMDTTGVTTHRADTTVRLVAGSNPPIALRMAPLASSLGLTVSFSGARVSVSDTSARALTPGDTLRIIATGQTASGTAIAASDLTWGTSNPAVAAVAGGLVTAGRPGTAVIGVSYLGASIRIQVTVTTVPAFASIATGRAHTCALTDAGVAYCWGLNDNGQLGDQSTTNRAIPTKVSTTLVFRRIAVGGGHTCAVTTNDVAYCWGSASFGQLGDGTTVGKSVPTPVTGNLAFASIATGDFHTCGLLTSGGAQCWGLNADLQLGIGTTGDRAAPTAVSGNRTFTSLAAGSYHTCATTTDGSAFCWGRNDFGALGDSTTSDRSVPTAVLTQTRFRLLVGGADHTCGISTQDVVSCWGRNLYGELGNQSATASLTPRAITFSGTAAAISSSPYHTCLVDAVADAYCWGLNNRSQLGDGTTTNRATPVKVTGLSGVRLVSAGGVPSTFNSLFHTCSILQDRSTRCWGSNDFGQVGDGTTTNRTAPTAVRFP